MKFGKTFESHLTTEWRQQYMNYAVTDSIPPSYISIRIIFYL